MATKNFTMATAHRLLEEELRKGNIKPEECYFCGSTKFIDGHHYDYSKPLEVVWMCKKCHKRFHLLLKKHSVG